MRAVLRGRGDQSRDQNVAVWASWWVCRGPLAPLTCSDGPLARFQHVEFDALPSPVGVLRGVARAGFLHIGGVSIEARPVVARG